MSESPAPNTSDAGGGWPCPYCGQPQPEHSARCEACAGLFEPLSRQATQNAMGAWFIRDEEQPFRPGCSHQTLRKLAARGKISLRTVIRGPTTRQFWALARDTPGVANLLGECHNCHGAADPDEYMCRGCGAVFIAPTDRQQLGLAPVRLLPGDAPASVVAAASMARGGPLPPVPRPEYAPAPTGAARPLSPLGAGPVATVAAAPLAMAAPAPANATRRLRRQVSNLRGFVAALAVVNVGLLAALVAVALRPGPAGGPATAGEPAAPAAVVREGAQTPAEAMPATPLADEAADEAAEADAMARAGWRVVFDAAIERSEADTVKAVGEAVEELQRIRREAAPGLWPEGLEAEISRLTRRLDDLNLRKFL